MEERGLSVSEWATKAGVARTTIARPIKDDYQFVTSARTLAKLAAAAGVNPPDFASGGVTLAQQSGAGEVRLPIRYEVAAGGFLRRDDQQDEPYGFRTVTAVPPYLSAPQWLERVVSDSMDRLIPAGAVLHVVDAIAIEYEPRTGDVVIVERISGQGSMVERTVKQVEVTTKGVELWPRSMNARNFSG